MREHLRWVEEAEARQARQFAATQHAATEPRMGFWQGAARPTLIQRLRDLALRLPLSLNRWRQASSHRQKSV